MRWDVIESATAASPPGGGAGAAVADAAPELSIPSKRVHRDDVGDCVLFSPKRKIADEPKLAGGGLMSIFTKDKAQTSRKARGELLNSKVSAWTICFPCV
jgi:hypothetical protein